MRTAIHALDECLTESNARLGAYAPDAEVIFRAFAAEPPAAQALIVRAIAHFNAEPEDAPRFTGAEKAQVLALLVRFGRLSGFFRLIEDWIDDYA
jgi:hypothetical protein